VHSNLRRCRELSARMSCERYATIAFYSCICGTVSMFNVLHRLSVSMYWYYYKTSLFSSR